MPGEPDPSKAWSNASVVFSTKAIPTNGRRPAFLDAIMDNQATGALTQALLEEERSLRLDYETLANLSKEGRFTRLRG